jgi:hypothetical protein
MALRACAQHNRGSVALFTCTLQLFVPGAAPRAPPAAGVARALRAQHLRIERRLIGRRRSETEDSSAAGGISVSIVNRKENQAARK